MGCYREGAQTKICVYLVCLIAEHYSVGTAIGDFVSVLNTQQGDEIY